jgi:hypothetical protein
MAQGKVWCYLVYHRPFRGASNAKPLNVSVHAHSQVEARKLYANQRYSLQRISFKRNVSCTTAHTTTCLCARLVACTPDLSLHAPEPRRQRPAPEKPSDARQRNMMERLKID